MYLRVCVSEYPPRRFVLFSSVCAYIWMSKSAFVFSMFVDQYSEAIILLKCCRKFVWKLVVKKKAQ